MIILLFLASMALFADQLSGYGPDDVLLGVVEGAQKSAPPCIHLLGCPAEQSEHWFGLDGNGRDLFTRVMHGTRISLFIGFLTVGNIGGSDAVCGCHNISGGLHGVGVSVVNALSEWLKVETARDGKIWGQEYRRGDPVAPVKLIGPSHGRHGTTTVFMPDSEVFDTVDFNFVGVPTARSSP